MTDLEWARAFVGCKIEGTGVRFAETVKVLVKKLAQAREEAAADGPRLGATIARGAIAPSLTPRGQQGTTKPSHLPLGAEACRQ